MAEEKQEVPPWMEPYGIKKGEYLSMTKDQLRTMQRPGPGHTLKTQVWATGMLHSPGYKGERATTMRNNRLIPLTAGEIANELHRVAIEHYQTAGITRPAIMRTGDDGKEYDALKETKEHIRRALEELEIEGSAERRTLSGKPIRELSPEEARRLSGGKIVLYFFLKPRPADPNRVKADWKDLHISPVAKNEVAATRLLHPPIRQILNTFRISLPPKEVLTNPQYQEIVADAWEKSRRFFLAQLEGATTGGPTVATTQPLEVAATGGAFEIKGEIKEEKKAGGRASSSEGGKLQEHGQPGGNEPACPLPDPLFAALTRSGFLVTHRDVQKIRARLQDCPNSEFLDAVHARKQKGRFGVPVLLEIASEARERWKVFAAEKEHERAAEAKRQQEARKREIQMAEEILAASDSNEVEIQWAKDTLEILGKEVA